MTTITVPLVEHIVQVVTDGFEYRGECSCGWAGDWTGDDGRAEADGTGHREVAVTAIDRLMSDLLDLQDDLAAVVMWLAEHWSADLPVPWCGATSAGNAGSVNLLVTCATASTLARVAGLLGTAVIRGAAARRFGRVLMTAYVVAG